MKRIFISSADVVATELNLSKYIALGKYIFYECGVTPIMPHLNSILLNYKSGEDRLKGILASKDLLFFANEMWIVGSKITETMEREIAIAKILKIPIKFITDEELETIIKKYGGTKIYVEETK